MQDAHIRPCDTERSTDKTYRSKIYNTFEKTGRNEDPYIERDNTRKCYEKNRERSVIKADRSQEYTEDKARNNDKYIMSFLAAPFPKQSILLIL